MKKVVKINILLLFLVIAKTMYGGDGTYNSAAISISNYYASSAFTGTQKVITLQDDQYHYMHNNPLGGGSYTFVNHDANDPNCTINDFLSLQYTGVQNKLYPNGFNVTVTFSVVAYDTASNPLTPVTGTLSLHYSNLSHVPEKYKDDYQFKWGDSIVVYITGVVATDNSGTVLSSVPQDVELTSRITVNRFWKFNQTVAPTIVSYTPTPAPNNNTLNLNWSYVPGAESYDLEWVFVSSYVNQTTTTPDFTQATRINTTEQNYSINLAYDAGTIYWRVRGVGPMEPEITEVRDGEWSPIGNIKVNDIEPSYNWTYSAAYAEEGKRKEVLSFFDGSTRQRQAVTENNTSNVALISETMYDYEGRAAITTLAAPDAAYDSRLDFYADFSQNLAGVPYSRKDFDVEEAGVSCPTPLTPAGMNALQGAGNYYSSNNELSQYGLNAAIPDAGNPSTLTTAGTFPFTETFYDLQGRVAEQAGPGTTLNEGSGHTTKYFYGTPLEANIYKLFGSIESGDPSHYQEKAVEDPNGQVSISYLDMAGKVVATSITGPSTGNLVNLNETNSQFEEYTSILTTPSTNTFNEADDAMELNDDYLNVTNGGICTFTYTLNPAQLITCLPKTFTVSYDLAISVTDPCGNVVALTPVGTLSVTSGTLGTTATGIAGTQLSANTTFSFSMICHELGDYQISKVLTIDPEGLAEALKCYDDSLPGGCPFTTLSQYNTNYTNSVNTNNSCLTCDGLCAANAAAAYPNGPQSSIDAYTATCEQTLQCGTQTEYIDPCAGLLGALGNDMSPGGQYFDDRNAATLPSQPADSNWLVNNVSSWVWGCCLLPGSNTNNCSSNTTECPSSDLTFWQNFNTFINTTAGCTPPPAPLNSWANVMQYWQPCYAQFLVKYHPEYCRYKACAALSTPAPDPTTNNPPLVNSTQFDQFITQQNAAADNPSSNLSSTNIWAESYPSISTPYINLQTDHPVGVNLLNADPFFNGGPGAIYKSLMLQDLTTASFIPFLTTTYTLSLWAYANSAVEAVSPTPYPANSNATFAEFVGLYETRKNYYIEQMENAPGSGYCIGFCDAGILPPANPPVANDIATISGNGTGNPNGCSTPNNANGFYIRDPDYQTALLNYTTDYINNNTIQTTTTTTLPICCNTNASATFEANGYSNSLVFSCSPPPAQDTAYVHVYVPVLPEASPVTYTDITCGGALISNLSTTVSNFYYEISIAINNCNSGYTATFNPNGIIVNGCSCTGGSYGNAVTPTGPSLTISGPCSAGNALNCSNTIITGDKFCTLDGATDISSSEYQQALFCGGVTVTTPCTMPNLTTPNCLCVDLDQIQTSYTTQGITNESFENFAIDNLDNTYNVASGVLTPAIIDSWTVNCQSSLNVSPTDNTGNPVVPSAINCNPQPSCAEDAYTIASYYATQAYNQELEQWNANFIAAYNAAAFNTADQYSEVMSMSTNTYETHYTLYYYDLAGNLTRTVPPAGSENGVLTPTQVSDIENGISLPITPAYTKVTDYQYNSLNELVQESTPDAGTTSHYYDLVGRLRFTQNAKQFLAGTYSYTKYDPQGRIIEVGESNELIYPSDGSSYTGTKALADETFPGTGTEQVTQTYYDQPFPSSSAPLQAEFDGGSQQFLIGRVATTTFAAVGGTSPYTYDYATHYSYDPHGNVCNIVQDNPFLDIFTQNGNQEYKKIRYEYDLVSGNVNMVDYQPGAGDRFIHRYEYDADNRLTNAYTSPDSVIWDQDAKYFYYLHGPLARTEIGQDKVQGMDYAYTINGWLKGVNDNVLTPATDIGQDGIASSYLPGVSALKINAQLNIHQNIAQDAYGFTLNYFTNDYTAVAPSTSAANNFYANGMANLSTEDLFNGNIKQMAVALTNALDGSGNGNTPMQMTDTHYQYDQLNRILQSLPYEAPLGATGYSSAAPTAKQDYLTTYSYDPDGNILNLYRNTVANNSGTHQNTLDNLTYNYISGANGPTNMLDFVQNQPTPNSVQNEGNLPAGQTSGNYTYDAIGELTGDNGADAQIQTIKWSVYGKVLSVNRIPGAALANGSYPPDLQFYYDPSGERICKIEKPRTASGEMTQQYWVYTYYVRDASGNIMATYNRTFSQPINTSGSYVGVYPSEELILEETPIYGSKRIGDRYANTFQSAMSYGWAGNYTAGGAIITNGIHTGLVRIITGGYLVNIATPPITGQGPDYQRNLGNKSYELTDHLGNVLMTVSDRKLPIASGSNPANVDHYIADAITTTDYYPFGQSMAGRQSAVSPYRFGYNGMEGDPEMKGPDNSYTTEFRMYDPRLGRWFARDPVVKADESPYSSFGNDPILDMDPEGNDWYENSKGEIRWNNERNKISTQVSLKGSYDTWTDISGNDDPYKSSINVITNSFIPKPNDVPVRGAEGNKLQTQVTLTGNYDENGTFYGFSYTYARNTGETFDNPLLLGTENVPGKHNTDKNENNPLFFTNTLNIETHSQVNIAERMALNVMGHPVDVNQNLTFSIDQDTKQLSISISHGTYPSVQMSIVQDMYSTYYYQYSAQSFVLSHADNVGQYGMEYVQQSMSDQENSIFQQTNKAKFEGFSAHPVNPNRFSTLKWKLLK